LSYFGSLIQAGPGWASLIWKIFFPVYKINLLKRDLILDSGVPEEAINFVLNSAELRKLSYFLIKTGFKYGFFLCLAYNTLHMQLSEEAGNYLPGDWPIHLIS